MTTTSTFSGMEKDTKPSSRVLRPPGGGSSNIFGGEPVQRGNGSRPKSNDIFGTGPVEPTDEHRGKRRGGPSDNSRDNVFGGSTVQDSGSNTRAENKRRGQGVVTVKTKGEEFPEYDPSVYAAHRNPQRRNIKQVSTYNPITGQMYAGFEDTSDEIPFKGKRAQLTSMGNGGQTSAYNPITGEPIESPQKTMEEEEEERRRREAQRAQERGDGGNQPPQQATHTSSRVLAPPGGKSSGPLW
ncbi:jupiter microtubule associated homolog 1 isoform X2 [Magallana gigas]|uniref:jupiter microtubule associated homolog 1 isoform X2 n=1 Tax=Magallana gigas TaxID=29159 RepID=UPI00333F3778